MSTVDPRWGKIGIVLCGGGYKGVIQALRLRIFMKWLEVNNLKLSHITASSVGAYNAIALAEDPSPAGAEKLWRVWEEVLALGERFYKKHPLLEEKLKHFVPHSPFHHHSSWKELRNDCRHQWNSLMNFVGFISRLFWTGIYFLLKDEIPSSAEKIGKILDHFFGVDAKAFFDPSPLLSIIRRRIDFWKVMNSPVELFVIALRFSDRKTTIFSNRDHGINRDRIFRYVIASAALYPYFEAVEIDSKEYIDGDIADPLPIEITFDANCDTVFAFLNTPACLERTRGTLLEDTIEPYTIVIHRLVSDSIVKSQQRAKKEGKNLFIFRPASIHRGIGTLSITNRNAIEFHTIQDTRAMENYLHDIWKYNLRNLPDIEDYRKHPELFSDLDPEIHAYLKGL